MEYGMGRCTVTGMGPNRSRRSMVRSRPKIGVNTSVRVRVRFRSWAMVRDRQGSH